MLKIIKKVSFVKIFWVLFYLLMFSLLLKGGFSYLDPDFGWHLKVGEEISLTQQVPHQNLYNYTYTGNWVDHEWLSDFLVYKTYVTMGYEAVVIIFAFIILLALIGLNLFIKKKLKGKTSFFIVAALELFGILAALPHFGVRIQEIALLFLLAILVLIETYNKKDNWRYLLILPPLFYLWANLHASFLIGLVILFSWLGVKVIERIISKKEKYALFINKDKIINKSSSLIFLTFSLLSFLATLITPYGLELYGFLVGYKNKAYLSLIQEWLPQYSYPFYYNQVIYLALGTVVLIFIIYMGYRRQKKIDIWSVFLMSVFIILSFKSRRHFPLFFIVSLPLMAEFYSKLFQDLKRVAYINWLKGITLLCLLLVIFVQVPSISPKSEPFKNYCLKYPCRAKDFLQENRQYLEGNIFNYYGWGGYFIWTMPEKKFFIDGRLPQIELASKSFIEEYRSFFLKNENQAEKLDEYNISLIIIPATDKEIKPRKWESLIFNLKEKDLAAQNYLRKYLENSVEWKLIYSDNTAHVYNKRSE